MQTNRKDNSFVVVCATFLAILALLCCMRVIFAFIRLDSRLTETLWSIMTQIVIMFLLPLVVMMIYNSKKSKKQITFAEFTQKNPNSARDIFTLWKFKNLSWKIVGIAVLLGFLMFMFNIFVANFFNGILAMLGHRGALGGGGGGSGELTTTSTWWFFGLVLLGAVLPGFCEEVTHRGLLLQGFASRIGILRAVWLSSVLFGFMHLSIIQCLFAIVMGYLMALAVVVTKSIWTAVIIHFMNNGIHIYLSFADERNLVGGDFFTQFVNFFNSLGTMYFIVYPLIFWGLYCLIIMVIHFIARHNFIQKHRNDENPPRLHRNTGLQAIRYYISYGEKVDRRPLDPLERTLFYGMFFLGGIMTLFTLVWGFL